MLPDTGLGSGGCMVPGKNQFSRTKVICTIDRWFEMEHLGPLTSSHHNHWMSLLKPYLLTILQVTQELEVFCCETNSAEVQLKARSMKYQKRQGNSFCALVQGDGFVCCLCGSSSFDFCTNLLRVTSSKHKAYRQSDIVAPQTFNLQQDLLHRRGISVLHNRFTPAPAADDQGKTKDSRLIFWTIRWEQRYCPWYQDAPVQRCANKCRHCALLREKIQIYSFASVSFLMIFPIGPIKMPFQRWNWFSWVCRCKYTNPPVCWA